MSATDNCHVALQATDYPLVEPTRSPAQWHSPTHSDPRPRATYSLKAEVERGRRMMQHGAKYVTSPTHKAIYEELHARADAKALATVAKVGALNTRGIHI